MNIQSSKSGLRTYTIDGPQEVDLEAQKKASALTSMRAADIGLQCPALPPSMVAMVLFDLLAIIQPPTARGERRGRVRGRLGDDEIYGTHSASCRLPLFPMCAIFAFTRVCPAANGRFGRSLRAKLCPHFF
jgi:hypothetical protein